ncbi:ATP binding to DnaK triggers the release of the substrate protein [Seminavis robusta]|uniref:ATP binding to DnaK triggers the release of the substrate protein n=1 Tax=Seminavis robusta TaxID=568900 RepID=A0A9N8EGM8_9STRA|nr:ATP binding to DnaK triggers the release of the substrate protein [Seminavis robusta]|eukprot:Sro1099_g241150.1 ATP binding to DnaK triggers the release of the substrate protein (531) ;mRNA; f:24786-26378
MMAAASSFRWSLLFVLTLWRLQDEKAVWAFTVPTVVFFSLGTTTPSFSARKEPQKRFGRVHVPRRSPSTRLWMSAPDLNANDPWAILGLNPNDSDSLDKKAIKKAYRRLAIKYHPDVATNKDSTEQEKKRASDQFAKINAAYETLLGKRGDGNYASAGQSQRGSTASGWTPPHRRKPGDSGYSSAYSDSSSSNRGGTSWEDFMPKYDDDQYDAGGDSFGSIFADLLVGAAGTVGSRGGSGVIQDFVEFLERNVDGYSSVGSGRDADNDADLSFLLQTGTVDEIGEELDESDLVVQQLSTKMKDLDNEVISLQADLAASSRFSEKIALEEKIAECEARKGVVEKYLRRARKRLLALQTRYKQLIVGGANDNKAGGRSRSRDRGRSETVSTTSSTSSRQTGSSSGGNNEGEDSWKSQGFGSNGRGRGSGRRRAARSTSAANDTNQSPSSSASSPRWTTTNESPSSAPSSERVQSSSSSGSSTYSSSSSSSSSEYNVPPHRRSRSNQDQDDKERLRQLKVDDEFEKLKKELGL